MPEVVEVYVTREYLNKVAKNKVVHDIIVHSGRYIDTGFPLFKGLNKPKITKIGSKGKFMWIELDDGNKKLYLLNTYGLTGGWSTKKDKYVRVELVLGSKSIYYYDKLGFGTIELGDAMMLSKKLNSLAADILLTNFTEDIFYNKIMALKNKKMPIITLLMDQKKLFSGIGNYLGAEILYHAKIDPHSTVNNISKNKALCNILSKSIKYITKLSLLKSDIGYLSELDDDFKLFITELRKTIIVHPDIKLKKKAYFEFNVYNQEVDPLGNPITKSKIIKSRTTYWCPAIQKLY